MIIPDIWENKTCSKPPIWQAHTVESRADMKSTNIFLDVQLTGSTNIMQKTAELARMFHEELPRDNNQPPTYHYHPLPYIRWDLLIRGPKKSWFLIGRKIHNWLSKSKFMRIYGTLQ